MAQEPIRQELIDELMAEYQGPSDLTGPDGLIKQLVGRLIETRPRRASSPIISATSGAIRSGRGSGNSPQRHDARRR